MLLKHLGVVLGGAVLLSAALVLWAGKALRSSVASEPAFALARAPFYSVGKLPACLEPGVWKTLHKGCVAPLPARALDSDAATLLGRALEKSPWVREVRSVDVDATPKVRVDLVFREPVATVPWGGSLGYVDQEGVLLPRGHYRLTSLALPRIVGIRKGPPAAAGQLWADPGLKSGLAVLQGLPAGNPATALDLIDVTNVGELKPGLPEVVCRTRRGIRLHFSVSGKPGRPTLEEQMGRLGEVLKVDRDLTLPRQYVELRFGRPVGS